MLNQYRKYNHHKPTPLTAYQQSIIDQCGKYSLAKPLHLLSPCGLFNITITQEGDNLSPADMTDMYTVEWRERDLPDDRLGVFELGTISRDSGWLVFAPYVIKEAREEAARQTHKGNRQAYARAKLQAFFTSLREELEDGTCCIRVTASKQGVELGSDSLSGLPWGDVGESVVHNCLIEEAVRDATATLATLCTCDHNDQTIN